MLLQAESSSSAAELISTLDVSGAGIGYPRPGLKGAHTSLRDARRAARGLLAGSQIACFENQWLWAILIEALSDVAPLIEQVTTAARDHPMLAECALTFGDQHFSAAAAARISGTHPNTILYRLSRWQQESGCDPRTVIGHVTTRLAVWLVRTDTGSVEIT
jgi:DNA-binding PucR family transcriptional regulator